MAPGAAGTKEGSNIEENDVTKLVSKLDVKHNVKVTAQSKGQKNNHSLIKGSDEGVISSMIQSTNASRIPSSGSGTAVHPKERDPRSKAEHSRGTKLGVPTPPCSITMLCIPTDLWQQECVTVTKHAHHVINLANEDINLVGPFNEHWDVSRVLQHSQLSNLCKIASALLAKHQNRKVSFSKAFHRLLSLVCGQVCGEEL